MQQYADIYLLQSSFAVNKYLHTVASVGFLFTLNYDARNHELKIYHYVIEIAIVFFSDSSVIGSQLSAIFVVVVL